MPTACLSQPTNNPPHAVIIFKQHVSKDCTAIGMKIALKQAPQVWTTRVGQVVLRPQPRLNADALEADALERVVREADDLLQAGYRAAAAVRYMRAIAAGAYSPGLFANTGHSFFKLGNFDAAIRWYRRACEGELANDPELWNMLGASLLECGDLAGAEAHLRACINVAPGHRWGHINLGLTLLRRGDFSQGTVHFERRLDSVGNGATERPRWRPSQLADKHVYLESEQGYGDTIQFLRFAGEVARLGAKVTLRVPKRLVKLLDSSPYGIDLVTALTNAPFTHAAPLMSLLHRLSITRDTIPRRQAYLAADPVRAGARRSSLPARSFNIGLIHHGEPTQGRHRMRAIPPAQLARLVSIPGVTLFDLQRRAVDKPGPRCWRAAGVVNLGSGLDAGADAFLDTAAIMSHLDLVVTCDTSSAHLAGALGVRTFILLDYSPDWRWFDLDVPCPWYPSARLFKQSSRGDWRGVLDRVCGEVATLAAAKIARTGLD
ncbi:MAG: hypothetical protein GKR94_24550 [Gammaproteobacteria bacterium]|nr:hypothetical protein [Gammaproteobacteria bacterium]